MSKTVAMRIKGKISYYGVDPIKEHLNKCTASGDIFDPEKLTCALPQWVAEMLGVKWHDKIMLRDYEACGECTGKCGNCKNAVIVEYNDTGPNTRLGRIADASRLAAEKLGFLKTGVKNFEVSKVKNV